MDINLDNIELYEPVEEGFGPFSQRKPLKDTLAKAEKKMRRRCRTVEACNEVIAEIKDSASTFTSHLKAMQNIAKELESGQIDKREAQKQVAPHYKALKKASDLINYGQVIQNKTAVSEDDIKFLRDYIKGLDGIAQQIKAELKNASTKASFIGESEEYDFDDSAYESVDSAKKFIEGDVMKKRETLVGKLAEALKNLDNKTAAKDKEKGKQAVSLMKEAFKLAAQAEKKKCPNTMRAAQDKLKESARALPLQINKQLHSAYKEIYEDWSLKRKMFKTNDKKEK